MNEVWRGFQYWLVNDIEDTIFRLESLPYRGAERKIGLYANKGYRQLFFRVCNRCRK